MSEGGHGGHHFKLILAILLVAGILGLVAYGTTGQKFLEALKVGKVTGLSTGQAEPFGISLSTVATALYGKSFSISGSPFSFAGVCSQVTISGLKIENNETRCSGSSSSFTGSFQYTQFGSILFVGSADSITINSNKYSTDKPITFELEAIPTGFTVTGVSQDKLSLVAPSGKVEKFGKDGSLKSVAYLSNSSLDINSLFSNVQLDNGELKITGTAISVKSADFSW